MEYQKNLLKKYILYLLIGLLICLIGITGVFAETTTQTFSTFNTTAESLSNSIQCNNDVCVVYGVNHYNYDMNFEWGSNNSKTCINQATVSGTLSLNKDNFGMINQDFGYSNVYIVDNNIAHNCNYQVKDTYTTYTCTIDTLSTNFKIGYSLTAVGGQYSFNSIIYRNIDITCDTSTTQIIENNNQNTQNIINNNNSNTQSTINSSASNTQSIINSNKENLNSCYTNVLNKNQFEAKYSNGLTSQNRGVVYINYYLKKGNTYSFSTDISLSTYEYSIAIGRNQWPGEIAQNLLWETGYIRDKVYTFTSGYNGYVTLIVRRQDNNPFGINPLKSYNWQFQDGVFSKFVAYNEEFCINKLDEQNETSKGILGKIKDLFNFFSSDDDADITGLNNMAGWLPPGPLDSIINLPLNLFQALINTLSGTCTPVTLTLPFVNQQLILPCFDTFMSQYLTGFPPFLSFKFLF